MDGDEIPGELVELHDAVVVEGVQRLEERGGHGHERDVLDVGVVVRAVHDDVVHVVGALQDQLMSVMACVI